MISVHTSPLATLGGADAGGMNVYIRELSCHLAQRGCVVDIFTRRTSPHTPECQAICPGVTVIAINAGPPAPLGKDDLFPLLPAFATEMARYSLRHSVRYDAVHAHYWLSGWTAQLMKQHWHLPFVQMFHTTTRMKHSVAGPGQAEPQLRADIERRLVALADSTIAANPDEQVDLIRDQGASAAKVCSVPPGVDLQTFQPGNRSAARQSLGLPNDESIILFVGRVDPIKGIDTLLVALALLQARTRPRPQLLLIGGDLGDNGEPTGALADVQRQARSLGVESTVIFAGSQPQDLLPAYYRAADIVAVPSRYESFGLVAAEALACGTPVVASRTGGLRFIVDEERSGLLVPPNDPKALADSLHRVLLDRALHDALASGALSSVQRFSWPTVADAILRVYDRLAVGERDRLCHDTEMYG